MKALLINNKTIKIDEVEYKACPELEEYQEYTVTGMIDNVYPDHPVLYVIEESERWLLSTRFVPLETEEDEIAIKNPQYDHATTA